MNITSLIIQLISGAVGGNEQKAFEMFSRCASLAAKGAKDTRYLRPPEAAAWYQLSDFYSDTHNEDASLRCFMKARSLGPEGLER